MTTEKERPSDFIRDIIAAAPEIALAARRLVLQPMRDAAALRRWLWANGWSLCAECMAREGDHYYTVLAAKDGRQGSAGCDAHCSAALAREAGISDEIVAELGPLVIARPDPLLLDWIKREIRLIAALDAEIAGAPGSAPARREELAARRRELQTLCARLTR
jgi:tRNA (adenine22-N1)-methyltransferase